MIVKVCKFGGTSMADATAIERIADIVNSDEARRFVVVSAPGKRFGGDIKVTDLFYKCIAEVKQYGNCDNAFDLIKERINSIISELGLDLDLNDRFNAVKTKIEKECNSDYAASRGEYFGALIVAEKLGFEFVDAEDIIKFKENGDFDSEYTNDLASVRLKKAKCAVIPGFYGSMFNGAVKTFSRGGSDITGSIIARAVKATVYENWTDVSGFMACDPRIVPNSTTIKTLTYDELRELAYMGAGVLHPDAIFPVRVCGIPINIRNTFAPEENGTVIVPSDFNVTSSGVVTGIAGKKNFTVINIVKTMMNQEVGFARRVLSVLEYFGVPFEHMPSGIDTLSLVIETSCLVGKIDGLLQKIKEAVAPDNLTITNDIALIATVGNGMCKKTGTAGKLCHALASADINIKMIDQGSSEMNIIIGVHNNDYEKAIEEIYKEFFE